MSTQIGLNGVTYGDGSTQNAAVYMAANSVVLEANTVISSDYTMGVGKSGLSAGAVTINTGVTVTIPSGSSWTIV